MSTAVGVLFVRLRRTLVCHRVSTSKYLVTQAVQMLPVPIHVKDLLNIKSMDKNCKHHIHLLIMILSQLSIFPILNGWVQVFLNLLMFTA